MKTILSQSYNAVHFFVRSSPVSSREATARRRAGEGLFMLQRGAECKVCGRRKTSDRQQREGGLYDNQDFRRGLRLENG